MTIPLLGRVDALVGDGVEAAVRYKHRRRLSRLGWGHVFEPRAAGRVRRRRPAAAGGL